MITQNFSAIVAIATTVLALLAAGNWIIEHLKRIEEKKQQEDYREAVRKVVPPYLLPMIFQEFRSISEKER